MRTLTALALLLTATTASADIFGDCSFTEKRNVAAPAAGVSRIVIIGRAGYLHINGRRGAGEVRATGTACASSRDILSDTKLTLSRSGSELRIEAETPDNTGIFSSAKLDFDVTVPDNVALRVEDGSGDLTIDNAGSVDIASDGSGSADIRNVKHDVHIGNKGSGSVEVSDVGGNFRVGNKGGG